jgi:hypothetical protein
MNTPVEVLTWMIPPGENAHAFVYFLRSHFPEDDGKFQQTALNVGFTIQ